MSMRPWLIASLGLNVFLGVAFYIAMEPFGGLTPPPPAPDNGLIVKTNVIVRQENFTWDQVESTNYIAFIKNLRAIGCPEPSIRDLVTAEVNRLYAHRRLEEVVYPNYQWWHLQSDTNALGEASAKLEALDSERRELLTSLLGTNWDAQPFDAVAAEGGVTLTGPILGDLKPETKQAVYEIAARAQLKIDDYREAQRQLNQPVDPMEIVRLREEPLSQLIPVLNPNQYIEYALRYSPEADQLRQQMRSMELTPEQFQTLENAVAPVNGQPVFYYDGADAPLLGQQKQLLAQENSIIRQTMGETWYTAYQLDQDPVYLSSEQTAQQLGVPEASVIPIYEINRATQSELDRIRKDDTLSNDEKVEALAQTQIEQQQSIEEILGPDAFQRWLASRIH